MKDKEIFDVKDVVNRPIKVVECIDDESCSACSKCVLLHVCYSGCSLPSGYIFVLDSK